MKIAVYTAITAGRDVLREDQNFEGADYFAFLDQPIVESRWQMMRACDSFTDPVRNAKIHKILVHQYFPDYEYSLWLDGSIRLTGDVRSMVNEYLKDRDIALFGHSARDCLYEEGSVCSDLGLDDPNVIAGQMERYRRNGYPEKNGLHEAGVILRRHTEAIERLNNAWWSEICRHSRRDQLSFDYVCRALGIQPARLPGTMYDNSLVIFERRPPGFGG